VTSLDGFWRQCTSLIVEQLRHRENITPNLQPHASWQLAGQGRQWWALTVIIITRPWMLRSTAVIWKVIWRWFYTNCDISARDFDALFTQQRIQCKTAVITRETLSTSVPRRRTLTNSYSYSAKWRRSLCGPPMLRGHAMRQPSEAAPNVWNSLRNEWHSQRQLAVKLPCQTEKNTFLLLRTRADIPSAAPVYWLLVNIMAL